MPKSEDIAIMDLVSRPRINTQPSDEIFQLVENCKRLTDVCSEVVNHLDLTNVETYTKDSDKKIVIVGERKGFRVYLKCKVKNNERILNFVEVKIPIDKKSRSETIQSLRTEKFTQKQVAKILGVSQTTVSNCERKARKKKSKK